MEMEEMEEIEKIDYTITQRIVLGFIINYFNKYLFNQTKLDEIKESFFTDNNLKEIFKYIKNRAEKHEIIDKIILDSVSINGISLKELSDNASYITNIRPFIENMKQEYNNSIAKKYVERGVPFSIWKSKLLEIDETPELEDAYTTALKTMENINNSEERFKIGFGSFDDNKGVGFYRKTLNLLAGNVGSGKSTFSLQLAINFARNGRKILFFSQEMSKDELMYKIYANIFSINSYRFIINEVSEADKKRIQESKGELEFLSNIHFDYKSSITQNYVENMVKQYNPDIVFIDHLHIMGNSGKGENRTQELGTITAELKAIAKDQNICIILLSQLSRKDKKQLNTLDDYIPNLEDIRESGNIEANCDVIGFIFRPEYFLEKMIQGITDEKKKEKYNELLIKSKSKFNLLIKKNRNGVCKGFTFNFYPAYSRFEDVNNIEGE